MSEINVLPVNTPIDLNNCDKEPIHIPSLIQPHGILIVLEEPKLNIIQISQNTIDLLGIPPQDILGKNRAHLRLGGCGKNRRKQVIKATINPSQSEM